MLFINTLIFVVLLYFTFSFTEYFVHKYFMHSSESNILSDNHWNHHKHTLDDMNLKNSETYNNNKNKYLGLYFVWSHSILVFLIGLFEGFLLYFILAFAKIKIPISFVFIWVLLFSIYQTSFWNTIHPDIHNIKENLTIWEGIPGSYLWVLLFSSIYIDKNMNLYDWFKRNHKLHHLRKGEKKGNYNVTLPGADWIMGKMYSSVS